MTNPTIAKIQKTRRPVGRPRRLMLEQVLDAGLEIGLEGLTMARVAARLGVAVAVLYGYVGSREELIRLASVRAASRHHFPEDGDQGWTAYVTEYAQALYDLLTGNLQLVSSYMSGELGPAVQVDGLERWLASLTKRGFSREEALRLHRSVSAVVIGAAASFAHVRALDAAGRSRSENVLQTLRARNVDEIPLLKMTADSFATEESVTEWADTLGFLLRGVAAARGEIWDDEK